MRNSIGYRMENSMVLLSYACMHTHFQVEYRCLGCMYTYIWVCICRNNIYDRCLWKYIYPSIEQLQFSSEYFYSHWIGWMVNCKVERRLRKVKFCQMIEFWAKSIWIKIGIKASFQNLSEPIQTFKNLTETISTYSNL